MTKITFNTFLSMTALLLCGLLSVMHGQNTDPAASLDQMIKTGMEEWEIPGLSAIVVKDGEVVFHSSYGIKNVESQEPVDNETLFTMASTTKAVIAIAMGMLVDDGKLDWNDKVLEHYPSFRLSDPYIQADARVVDLFTHNLGYGNADGIWIYDSVSTKETLDRFATVPTAYPLRGGYTYQNLMYVIAGEVIGEVSGMHWTQFVDENVLAPLQMDRTQTTANGIFKAGNYATPYFNDHEDGVVDVPYTLTDQMGAAGMMWTCTDDISNYLKFLLNRGVFEGDTLLQPKTFDMLFTPQSIVGESGFYPTQQLTNPSWRTYGIGWFQHDYRGEKLDFHTGSIWGLVAIAGIMHDENVAVYVMANMDHAELRHAIMYKAMDLYAFDDNSRDWHTEIYELYSGYIDRSIAQIEERNTKRIQGTKPSLPLESYTGKYIHKLYGTMSITLEDGMLMADLNGRRHYKLEHWHYDTFMTDKDESFRVRTALSFYLNPDGKVVRIGEGDDAFVKQ